MKGDRKILKQVSKNIRNTFILANKVKSSEHVK